METVKTSTPKSYSPLFENSYKSPLVQATCLLTASCYLLSRFSWTQKFFAAFPWKSTLALSGIAAILATKSDEARSFSMQFLQLTRINRLVFEFLLVKNVIKNRFGSWEWMTEIEENIYLSALPLTEMGFDGWISLNNVAVLAIVEPFERETITLAGRAIRYDRIKEHKIISSPDFLPLTSDQLRKAAEWIKKQLEGGTLVLIHCKSGVGRSASCLAAHYVLNKDMSADAAREKIAEKRPMIYKKDSNHDRQIKLLQDQGIR